MANRKWCPRCREWKAVAEFGRNRRRHDGLNSRCKACANATSTELRDAQRYRVLAHYSQGIPRCACCAEERWEFLSIDHIKGGGRSHIREIGFGLTRWLWANGLPDGYRVLCHNCNFAIGHYGKCPHSETSQRKERARTRGESLSRGMRGEKHGLAKMDDEKVRDVRRRAEGGEKRNALAKEYEVDWSTIDRIVKRISWAHVV